VLVYLARYMLASRPSLQVLAVFQCQGTPLLSEIDVRPDKYSGRGPQLEFHEGDAHPGDNSFKCQGPAVAVPATGPVELTPLDRTLGWFD
jgi:hypothetical protein